jgi:choline kinase
VLAAGNGDRFKNPAGTSKLLQSVFGEPLIVRTLDTARDAGLTVFDVVLGYRAADLRAALEAYRPDGITLRYTENPDWHLENGLSALAARHQCSAGRFALLMGDHLFEARVLARALQAPLGHGESLLAVDSRPVADAIAAEATKVRLSPSGYVTAIGKDVHPHDALDTGLFVCDPNLFDALEQSCAGGDTTLSGGIGRLAARGLIRALDVGDAAWCDIDTAEDLHLATTLLDAQPQHV